MQGQSSPVQVKDPYYTGSILMHVGSSCKHTGVYNVHLPKNNQKLIDWSNRLTKTSNPTQPPNLRDRAEPYRKKVMDIIVYIVNSTVRAPGLTRAYWETYARVICNHCPPPPHLRGRAGIMTFSFKCPAMSPTPGGKLEVKTLLFAPPFATENHHGVRILMSKPRHFPCTEGTLENFIPASPQPSP